MELFKLFGTIAVNTKEADKAIDSTTDKAEQSESKMSKAFRKIGEAVTKAFQNDKPDKLGVSLKDLTGTVSEQAEKLGTLKRKYLDLYLTQGENAEETRKCANEIAQLSEELNSNVDKMVEAKKAADKFDKTLNDVGEEANHTESKFTKAFKAIGETAQNVAEKVNAAFNKIGNAAKTCGKVVVSGLAVASAAIIGLGASALTSYADCEQLVGGIETLFGAGGQSIEEYAETVGKSVDEVKDEYDGLMRAQSAVLADADRAYETAGLSANEYMEQVTSFSASLIQSLDGDTEAAAQKANQAIVDMSDNANKMGTNIGMIQNAYQGFAKQNYTMLDNLKLGYGGTKEEMARLLADAQAISGVEYDISSYADVVDAIHVIQEEMGVAGTTAKEASSTISGSFNSMKAAWKNLLAGLGNENADLSGLTDNLVNSALTVADNVIPRIEVILGGMVTVIEKLLPKLMQHLPSILQSFLPSLVKGATALVTGLIKVLPSILMLITEQLPFILSEIGTALVETAPVLFEAAQQLLGQLWEYLMTTFNSNGELNGLFSGISTAFSALWEVCSTIWTTIGQPIWSMVSTAFSSLYNLVAQNMPQIQAFVTTAFAGIQDTWENHLKPAFEAIGAFLNDVIVPAFEYAWNAYILPLVENVFLLIGDLWTNSLKPIFDGICDFITGVFTGNWQLMADGINSILTGLKNRTTAIFNAVLKFLADVWVNIESDVKERWNAIQQFFVDILSALVLGFQTKFTEAKNLAVSIFTSMKNNLSLIFTGIWNVIKGKINNIIGGVEKMSNGVVSGINSLLSGLEAVANAAGELLGFDPISIQLSPVELPRLANGGIVTKSTIAEIGEDGAEAIVPLERNTQWIQRVSEEMQMQGATSSNAEVVSLLNVVIELLQTMVEDNRTLPDTLIEAIAALRFELNNREFARLVKAVN